VSMEPVRSPQRSADSPRLLREINDHVVLGLLLAEGPMTRSRIGERTGLSKPTVSSLLNRLDERGLVTTTGVVEASGPGPNARIYAVNPRAAYVIGVHVEQHLSIAGLATLTGEVIATHAVEVPQRRESAPVDEMTAAVDGVLAAASLPRSAVHGVIVATPGVIDPITGHLRHARHIKGWETPGLTGLMTQTLGIPVSQGNDVNLAAVAEGLLGAARDRTDYALLWLDRGVGLGIVLGGSVRTGAHGGAGEIGYLPVAGVDHPRVDRGAAGGFQQLVGGQGMRTLAKRHGIAAGDPAAIVRAALAGGQPGDDLLAELAAGIALGATAVTTLLDPGLLVLGGPVALAGGQRLLELVVSQMRQASFVRPEVVLSTVHDNGVLHGAIEVALQEVRTKLFGQPAAALSRGAVG
jgi:predicted NBD/HSP70 family sugar kinase